MEFLEETLLDTYEKLAGAQDIIKINRNHSRAIAREIAEGIFEDSANYVSKIESPERVMLDYFGQGQAFKGIPVIRQFRNREGEFDFKLIWEPESYSNRYSSSESPFFYENPELPSQLSSLVFDEKAMHSLFSYFKSSVPHHYVKDGCNSRCLWISSILQEVFHLDTYKIKIWSKDGISRLQAADPFPQGTSWLMHTAPVLKIDGKEYVFDLSLDRPILLEDWKRSLFTKEEDVIIATESNWTRPCLSSLAQKGITDSFEEVRNSLRAFYLFEVIDGNDETTSSLEEWGFTSNGVTALVDPTEKEDLREVVLSINHDEFDQISVKTKKMPFSETMFEQFVLHEGKYYTPQALRIHLSYSIL
jgi:hypothetical protein